jgi:hypothetical protein
LICIVSQPIEGTDKRVEKGSLSEEREMGALAADKACIATIKAENRNPH